MAAYVRLSKSKFARMSNATLVKKCKRGSKKACAELRLRSKHPELFYKRHQHDISRFGMKGH